LSSGRGGFGSGSAPPAYLIAGHGLTTWAADRTSLMTQLEALELLFRCALAEG